MKWFFLMILAFRLNAYSCEHHELILVDPLQLKLLENSKVYKYKNNLYLENNRHYYLINQIDHLASCICYDYDNPVSPILLNKDACENFHKILQKLIDSNYKELNDMVDKNPRTIQVDGIMNNDHERYLYKLGKCRALLELKDNLH